MSIYYYRGNILQITYMTKLHDYNLQINWEDNLSLIIELMDK